MPKRKSSFWSTLPGVLTAVGGLLAAIAGLVTALYTAGMIGKPSEKKASPPESIAAAPSQPDAAKNPNPDFAVSKVDRTDAKSTAYAVLKAYRARDVITLAGLVNPTNKRIFVELAEQGEQHARYKSIFGENSWRTKAVQSWDGSLGESRYRHYVGTAANSYEAAVKFGEISPDEFVVVTLTWDDGKWNWEDMNSPSRESFIKGRTAFSLSAEAY